MYYAEILRQISLSILTGSGGPPMTITLDFWQLLSAMGAIFVLFCGFQWWLLRQTASISMKYSSVDNRISDLEDKATKHHDIGERVTALENKVMYRIEALEIMKNLDKFCHQLTNEMQVIIGKKIMIDDTDFQTTIIKRQQYMDEKAR